MLENSFPITSTCIIFCILVEKFVVFNEGSQSCGSYFEAFSIQNQGFANILYLKLDIGDGHFFKMRWFYPTVFALILLCIHLQCLLGSICIMAVSCIGVPFRYLRLIFWSFSPLRFSSSFEILTSELKQENTNSSPNVSDAQPILTTLVVLKISPS